ncbi:MAG: hypothetical protein WCJ19_02030 [bacterium]
MKSNTVLQYLSTASDTFLVVAFASLLALPVAIAMTTQPVVKQDLDNKAQVVNKVSNVAQVNTNDNAKVLGVQDSKVEARSPLQNVTAKFSNGEKNITIDQSSATAGEYTVGGKILVAGSYTVLTLTNNNDKTMNLDSVLNFIDPKLTQLTINVAGKNYTVTKDSPKVPQVVLGAKSQTTISVTATAKQLGSFNLSAKLS